jgi:hypothetical protein
MHLLVALIGLAAKKQTAALPDTPAAKQLRVFLTAFNSGDRKTIRDFIAVNFERPPNAPGFLDDLTATQMSDFAQSGALWCGGPRTWRPPQFGSTRRRS